MEQPKHDLRSQMGGSAAQAAPRRFGGAILVVLLHVGIVAGLIAGLKAGKIEKRLEDIKVAVEREKTPPKTPPPPPPDLVKPPPPFVPPPEFVIQTDAPPATNSITTTTTKAPPPPPAPPPPTKLEAITRTHTLPTYPTISQRLGEQGTTLLKVTIGTDGRVTDAVVQKSSGSQRLDDAAVEHVKRTWRWKPPTTNGKPSEAATLVSIVWNLKNAQ